MPNFKKHAATGAGVGIVLTAVLNVLQQQNRKANNPEYKFDWSEFALKTLTSGGIGAFCGVLPDLLEPATCPNHRKFCHSLTAASAIGYGMYKCSRSEMPDGDKEIVLLAGTAYLSHLFLDIKTPSGLPIIT